MATYRGVIRAGVVVLLDPVCLRDGVEVDVFVPATAELTEDELREAALEDAWEEEALAKGLLIQRANPALRPVNDDWEPLPTRGDPMSQQIIEDRR